MKQTLSCIPQYQPYKGLEHYGPEYLEGQNDAYYFTGFGLSFQYDTRDIRIDYGFGKCTSGLAVQFAEAF